MARETKEVEQRGVRSSTASGRGPLWGSVLFVSVALLLAGCPKRPEVQTGAVRAAEEKVVIGEKTVVVVEEASLNDVFFDFDKSLIRSDAKVALGNNIKWLKTNAGVRIVVEGHADERGTNEYNLALGNRRVKAVRDYLVAGGINAKRISTISYGEERPFVVGHDESAWKWNRRGHFVVAK